MKDTPTVRTIGILVLVVTLFGLVTYSFVSPKGLFSGLKNDLKVIDPATEELAYTDLDGNRVLLSSVKGKPLIINSWATWMPFSKDELAMLNELKKEYGDRVTILAINREEDKEFIKSYLAQFGISQDIMILVDPGDTFYKGIGGYAMPETVFYHDNGIIAVHKRGVLTMEELKSNIENILK